MKTLSRLQGYMGRRKALLPLAVGLSALGGLAGFAPFVFIWLIVKELLTGARPGLRRTLPPTHCGRQAQPWAA